MTCSRGSPRQGSEPVRSSGGCRCTASTRSSSRAPTATSTTPPKRARPGRSWGAPFCPTSLASGPGRIWTSPARPGISAAPTWARAPPAGACDCLWSSPAPTPPPERRAVRPLPRPPAPLRLTLVQFDPSPAHALIRRTVREFAEGEVAPVAEELDRRKEFPYRIVAGLGRPNLMGIPFPEGDGGGGGGPL